MRIDCIPGFNADITPVTVQTLLRWIGVSIEEPSDDSDESEEARSDESEEDRWGESEEDRSDEIIVVKRVKLRHRNILDYEPQPLSDALESSALLSPGLYGCFLQGKRWLPIDCSHEG